MASIGAVMLIVSLFLDWYDEITGFTVFEFLDLLLVLLALATIASLAGGLGARAARSARGACRSPSRSSRCIVVASQVINDPPAVAGRAGPGKDMGIWFALAGSGLMVDRRGARVRAHLAGGGAAGALTYVAIVGPGDEPVDAAAEVGRLHRAARRGGGVRRAGRGDGGGLPRRQAGGRD